MREARGAFGGERREARGGKRRGREARGCVIAAVVALVSLTAGGDALGATIIELSKAAEITSDRIELGALATVTGPEQASERLRSLDIGPAPLSGRSRVLTLGYLKMRIRRWGFAPEEMVFIGSKQVEVSRAVQPAAGVQPVAGDASPESPVPAQAPATVKRGARVQLAVECGAVRILAEATTLEDGVVGQPVRMRVEQTRQTLWATLLSRSQATLTP